LEDPRFDAFIVGLAHSAYDPAGFLKKTGRVTAMTLDSCKHFSWHKILMHDHLIDANRIALIDWKFGAEDVVWNISNVLRRPFALKAKLAEDAAGYEVVKAAQAQLWQPGLLRAKHALIMLGDEGDSIAFTIVPKKLAAEIMLLARELGLKPEGPGLGINRLS